MPVAGAVIVCKFTSVNKLKKMKKGPQSICSEFMILDHSLQSDAANMV